MTDTPPAGNSTYKKLAVQWLNEGQFFNQTSSRLGSNVLRNRQQKIPLSVTLHIKKNEKQHQYYKICTFVIIIKLRNYFDKNRT